MGDNQKEVPSSNFDLTADESTMYDSDTQLRTAIIRRLLNEYRTTNYFLANAMQSTFLQFFIHDPYSSIPPSEYNRPKSDNNYFETSSNYQIKIEELHHKSGGGQFNEYSFDNNMSELDERRNEIIFGSNKNNNLCKNYDETFRSEFDTISTNSQPEESVLLTGRTMHVDYENSCRSNRSSYIQKEFQFVDTELNNQIQQFEDIPSSGKSTSEEDSENITQFYSRWKKINKGKDKIQHSAHSSRSGKKTRSCSFNDSNRSTIDKYNDDTNNKSDRKESNCNKGKCKPFELASKEMADKISNNNSNDEYKIPPRRETKWQVFSELYDELNSSLKDQNNCYISSTESIKSRTIYDSRKASSHSSLEKKINAAINKLKDTKTKTTLNNNEKKTNNSCNKRSYVDDTSTDTEEVLVRNRYVRNKRIYNTRKYFTSKFRKSVKKRRNQVELHISTSSEDNNLSTPRQINNSMVDTEQHQNTTSKQLCQSQIQQKYAENILKIQQKCTLEAPHKMNDKLIHETIFENPDEEPHSLFSNYFQMFMDKFDKRYELSHKKGSTNSAAKRCHQESSTITCDDYSENNQSFNPNETSCANNSNVSIDKIANSGHSTSSFDSIDDQSVPLPLTASNSEDKERKQLEVLTQMSISTICLKSSNGAVDSGLGTSVREIKPIENMFMVKNPDRVNMFDVAPESATEKLSSNSSSEWSKICKTKLAVSKLPFKFSSSSKSKSSSENEVFMKSKPKMRVIFKREATVIDLPNTISCEKISVLSLDEKNSFKSREKKPFFHCLRNLFCCYN